jgi:hypothetical protein
MTRDQAKAWFEEAAATGVWPARGATEALGHAVEALSQPKFVALREGEVAVFEIDHTVKDDLYERIRYGWERYTGTRPVVLPAGVRLAGKVSPGPSYEVPAVPL